MELTLQALGVAAAALSVLGASWAAVRRLRRWLDAVQGRVADIESRLATRPRAVLEREVLTDDLSWVAAGTEVTVLGVDRGVARVRVDEWRVELAVPRSILREPPRTS